MITRTASDKYHILTSGGEIDLFLSEEALIERLRVTGYWTEEKLQYLRDFDIGDATRAPVPSHPLGKK